MPFNTNVRKNIVFDKKTNSFFPCSMCGTKFPPPDAVHIIDEKEWNLKKGNDSKENGIPLCPNCHRVFDEHLKPLLYKVLTNFGATNLPIGWSKSNKISNETN